jgi:hypothetical protein
VPVDPPVASGGVSADGSLRYGNLPRPPNGPHDRESLMAQLIDAEDGRIDLWNTDWDATVSFPASSQVRLDLRRYRHAGYLTAELDLARKRYRVFVGEVINGKVAASAGNGDASPEAPLSGIADGLEAASRRVEKIAPAAPGGHGSSRLALPSRPLAAWRAALLILVSALIAIAVAAYWSTRHAPADAQKLDVVPAMPK